MDLRDHKPIPIDQFNGLWKRGHPEDTPLDHFQDCNNIQFTTGGDVITRDGISPTQNVQVPLQTIKRFYNYPTQTANTLLVLTWTDFFYTPSLVSDTSNVYVNFEDDDYEDVDIFLDPTIKLQETVSRETDNSDMIIPYYTINVYYYIQIFHPSAGHIYHVVNSALTYGPILSVDGMTDFAFIPYAGRAYISPFATFNVGGLNVEKGLQNEFVYVYAGDGTAARKAAGVALPASVLTIANGAGGHTDPGFHIFGFVAETSSGYLTPPGALTTFTTIAANSVSFGNVPIYQGGVKRHLVASKVIINYNGNPSGYPLFFVPNGVINNNTDLFLNNISFFDADLLEDASHLFNNYPTIPASAVLSTYHNRLIAAASYTDISLALVSHIGEPEAISQIDGLIIVPLDGNPITNAAELRDVLYMMKRSRTVSYNDNGGEPSSWLMSSIDNALGTSVHGIGTVLDSGSTNIDFLLIATLQGISLFNGRYIAPELSWKIEDYWKSLDRNNFGRIQVLNAPIQKEIYIVLPNGSVLMGNYSISLDSKKIKWTLWTYDINVTTVAVWQISQILLGADL